jgi:hypothetical protein
LFKQAFESSWDFISFIDDSQSLLILCKSRVNPRQSMFFSFGAVRYNPGHQPAPDFFWRVFC